MGVGEGFYINWLSLDLSPPKVQRINRCYHFCYQNEPKRPELNRKTVLVIL